MLIQAFRAGAGSPSENLVAGATAVTSTAAAPAGAAVVRVCAVDQPFRVAIGAPGIRATNTSILVPTGLPEYFLCGPGDRVSVIRATATDANVNVTFLTR